MSSDTLTQPVGHARPVGLTSAEVADRVARGLDNRRPGGSGRSVADIIRANVMTPFNFLLGAMAVAVVATGSWRDALFGLVLVFNALIGVVQEVRAKRMLDRLAVLGAPLARVIRDGTVLDLPTDEVVLDDLLELRAGDQIVADAVLVSGQGLEVDESLLTGESDHAPKQPGDAVLSGTFVVVGSARVRVTAVGSASYASRMTEKVRLYRTTTSELMTGINRILKYVTVAVVVLGPILFLSQRRSTDTWQEAVQGAVAGMVGIVPEGLVLLTSVAFFAAAVSLGRRRVLIQELAAVEGLARIDVIGLDKTGTLTEGDIALDHVEQLNPVASGVDVALGALAAAGDANATLLAVRRAFPDAGGWTATATVPFSSARKWSGASFAGHGTWVLGAADIVRVAAGADDVVLARAARLAADGNRTLLLAHTCAPLDGPTLPGRLDPVALLVFHETLRSDAAETVAYFAAQEVAVKVISGDDPRTVGAVALRAGVPGAGQPVDARRSAVDAIVDHAVFGRVMPEQKREMVAALQAAGHVVAMTGDGVNDALALKEADIGVAMGSGAPATRAVAQVVLLDNRFSVMPHVVAEGRRVIANIERVAALFLTKNVSSLLLSLSVAIAGWPYPFLPRQVTLVSSLAIGVPGFFLALGPNSRRFQGGFVRRVLRFAVPAGVVTATAVMLAYGLARAQHHSPPQARTAATVVFLMTSLWVLVVQARPLVRWKVALVSSMGALSALAFVVPVARRFYELELPPVPALGLYVVFGALAAGAIEAVSRIAGRRDSRTTGPSSRLAA